MSDTETLQKIFGGDVKAFESVFEMYYEPLCFFTLKFLRDRDEVEEIVQDIFVKFWNKRAEINITSSLKNYLYQSVKNASLNRLQHLKVVREHEQSYLQNPSNPETSDQLVEEELKEKIKSSLDQLPPERKRIFLMSRNEGLKYREIAEKLNISIKTVENQMGKALQFMRSELTEFLTVGLILVIELVKRYIQ